MRLVLKLGSSTVTRDGALDAPRLIDYARAIAALRDAGHQIVLVSSGTVAAGRELMRATTPEPAVTGKQMLAAVGQPRLMALYGELFGHYGMTVAQVLLTRADLDDRRRYLNARNTFEAMLAVGVLPIVNENDTVATEEIRVGDNDQLSALVSSLVDARLLVLMTDQTGLFDANPRTHAGANLIARVDDVEIPATIWAAAGGSAGALGTGGMRTKLKAAEIARRNGADVVIADGRVPQQLDAIVRGDAIGTRFSATAQPSDARSRYILAGLRDGVGVRVDAGAIEALRGGRSLLGVGVRAVDGEFDRGDTVAVHDQDGRVIARGIANYGASELRRIAGKRSTDVVALLGYDFGAEFIHRDDLVMW
ncbi:MAG: glutamate 5-kinase [Rhodanobacteraceae bacterium]|nr:glutamate 5-kinase [Rhodanobacteraceae bacterium]